MSTALGVRKQRALVTAPEKFVEHLHGVSFSTGLHKRRSILNGNGNIFFFLDPMEYCYTAPSQREAHELFHMVDARRAGGAGKATE